MRPLQSRKISHAGLVSLLTCLFLVAALPQALRGDDGAAVKVLIERLDRLEAENLNLRQRVEEIEAPRRPPVADPTVTALFADSDGGVGVINDVGTVAMPEALPIEPAGVTALDLQQDERLGSLEKSFHDFVTKNSKTKFPTVQVIGVFQADAVWFNQDQGSLNDYDRIPNGVDFRRFRLAAKGQITPHTNYFAQVDFGFVGRPTIMDLFVEQTDVPIFGNVRLGNWKQPFSLEVVSSFRYTTFMERSLLFIPFTPFRHIGLGFYDVNDSLDMTWAASIFAGGNDQYGGSTSLRGGYGSAERITFLPMWECDGRKYLHLGLGHYFNAPNNHTVNFRTQPEAFVGVNPGDPGTSGNGVSGRLNGTPPFVSTGNIHVDAFNVLGTELLWVNGRFSLQSEAMVNFVSTRDQVGNAVFMATQQGVAVLPGAYIQAGYFLTDDYRPYDRKTGTIDRIIPRNNFGFCRDCTPRGWGAWEVAGRFSYLDLNDRTGTEIRGGQITDYTLGVNWYTTPYSKLVFNYIRSISEPGVVTGPIVGTDRAATDIFMTRFQLDF